MGHPFRRMLPGPRDDLVTRRLAAALAAVDRSLVDLVALDAADAPARLSRHLAVVIERALQDLGEDASAQAALVNHLLAVGAATEDRDAELVNVPPRIWHGLHRAPERFGQAPTVIPAPTVPLSSSDLPREVFATVCASVAG